MSAGCPDSNAWTKKKRLSVFRYFTLVELADRAIYAACICINSIVILSEVLVD